MDEEEMGPDNMEGLVEEDDGDEDMDEMDVQL